MHFSESDEFRKEFKKLVKKYHTLEQDLEMVKKVIAATPAGNGSKHWNVLKCYDEERYILKMRMMCRAVKGSQFRLIYYYDGTKVEVLFIEIYFKGNKHREDAKRIRDFIAKLDQA